MSSYEIVDRYRFWKSWEDFLTTHIFVIGIITATFYFLYAGENISPNGFEMKLYVVTALVTATNAGGIAAFVIQQKSFLDMEDDDLTSKADRLTGDVLILSGALTLLISFLIYTAFFS